MIDTQDPVATVQGFLAAMEARDLDTARALLAPGFAMVFPGTAAMTSPDALIAWAAPRYRHVRKTFHGFDLCPGPGDDATVYCRGTLSGQWPDGTAFAGIRFIDRFELTAGLIIRQDVWNDIADTKAAS